MSASRAASATSCSSGSASNSLTTSQARSSKASPAAPRDSVTRPAPRITAKALMPPTITKAPSTASTTLGSVRCRVRKPVPEGSRRDGSTTGSPDARWVSLSAGRAVDTRSGSAGAASPAALAGAGSRSSRTNAVASTSGRPMSSRSISVG